MKILIIIVGIGLSLALGYLYIVYRLMTFQYWVLHSAGKMETGNDLGEQMEKSKKNIRKDVPNFFKFYYQLFKGVK